MGSLIDSYRRFTQWGKDLSPAKNGLLAGLIAFVVSLGFSFVLEGTLNDVIIFSVGFALGVFFVKIADARD